MIPKTQVSFLFKAINFFFHQTHVCDKKLKLFPFALQSCRCVPKELVLISAPFRWPWTAVCWVRTSLDRPRKRRKQGPGVCAEVWIPHRGQSSKALYPRGLGTACLLTGRLPSGRDQGEKGDHSNLVWEAMLGPPQCRASKLRWPAWVFRGKDARDIIDSRSRGITPNITQRQH